MSRKKNELAALLAEQEKQAKKPVRAQVYDYDLPSEDDVMGIEGLDGKTFQFVRLMQCGITDYAVMRQRVKSGRSPVELVTPMLGMVYFIDRKSTPREKTKKAAVVPSERPSVTIAATPSTSNIAVPVQKRGRGRPKGSGKKQNAVMPAVKRPRGRPRKLAS